MMDIQKNIFDKQDRPITHAYRSARQSKEPRKRQEKGQEIDALVRKQNINAHVN